MTEKMKPSTPMEMTIRVNGLEIKDASITADGRILGLSDWQFHKVKVIILPDREEGADELIKEKEQRTVATKRKKAMGKKVDMDKLFEGLEFVDPDTIMHDVICPKCGYETRTFDVAVGKKRRWVKERCPTCVKNGLPGKMIFKTGK